MEKETPPDKLSHLRKAVDDGSKWFFAFPRNYQFAMVAGVLLAVGVLSQLYHYFVLGIAGVIAMVIALWRTYALDRQAKAALGQSATAVEQFKLAGKRLLSDQFAIAAELMGRESKDVESVVAARISGIYIFESLVKQAPAEFAEQVIKHLVAYIKGHAQRTAKVIPGEYAKTAQLLMLSEDVKVAFGALHSILDDKGIRSHFTPDIVDFSNQDFSRLVLDSSQVQLKHCKNWAGTNFMGASLHKTDFSHADLVGADFNNTLLRMTDLEGAKMGYANLSGAKLYSVELRDAVLCGAQMQNAIFRNADLRGVDFARADLTHVHLSQANMRGCNLSDATLERSSMHKARLEGANLTRAILTDADMQNACLWGALLVGAKLRGAKLLGAAFGETYMCGADIGDDLPDVVATAMDKKIWHSDESWARRINKRPHLADWDLEKYRDGYALAGVFENFAAAFGYGYPFVLSGLEGGEFHYIRVEAAELLANDGLPSNLPEKWRRWVEDIDPETHLHPEDEDPSDSE